MYKIGEFSRITELSVKTLRYYHQEELLVPDHIDDSSGYRYYSENAIAIGNRIRLLRSLEFNLDEIKEVLSRCQSDEDLLWYLQEKSNMFEHRIAHYKGLKKKIQRLCSRKEIALMTNVTNLEIVEREPVEIAWVRYKGRYDECGELFKTLFGAVKNAAIGPSMCIYHDEEYKETDADIECCVTVGKPIHTDKVSTRTLPGGRYLKVVYTGPYEEIGAAYHELLRYATQNNIPLGHYSVTFHTKGPGMIFKGNPNEYVTEVMIPLQEK